jgi:N-methylhydantoinase B
MEDGKEGSRNYTVFLHTDGTVSKLYGKSAQYHLKKGDVARLVTATGGGYGDPFERPVELIQSDVKNGYITLEQAEKDYGVVLNPDTLEVEKLTGGRK